MAEIVRMLKQRYPNLKLAYVSSRSFGGYAATTLNPEPYAYESAFVVRPLIRDQINGVESLDYATGKAPLLLWALTCGPTVRKGADSTIWCRSVRIFAKMARIQPIPANRQSLNNC